MKPVQEKIVFGKAKTEHLNIYEQRFHLLMKLIRIGKMLKNAKIIESKTTEE